MASVSIYALRIKISPASMKSLFIYTALIIHWGSFSVLNVLCIVSIGLGYTLVIGYGCCVLTGMKRIPLGYVWGYAVCINCWNDWKSHSNVVLCISYSVTDSAG